MERYRPAGPQEGAVAHPLLGQEALFPIQEPPDFQGTFSARCQTRPSSRSSSSPLLWERVPRELELHPAAQYDIPVTGHWDLEEQAMVREMVAHVASLGFEGDQLSGRGERYPGCGGMRGHFERKPDVKGFPGELQETLVEACSEHPRASFTVERASTMAAVARFQIWRRR